MKFVSDLLHKTPWWALLLGAVALTLSLAAFVTPYHIIEYRNDGETPEQRQAIRREVDNTFAENAIEIARSVILGMRGATSDPERRQELDEALMELDGARRELRDAGGEAQRARREALEATREAARSTREAIEEARKQVQESLKQGGVENEQLRKALDESLEAARQAEIEAEANAGKARRKAVKIGIGTGFDKPLIDVEVGDAAPGSKPGESIAPAPPLPPEVREKIRRDVMGDMYRIGIGAALIIILVPLLVLATVSKFFVDRTRASQRTAELKKKEADYHRMSQQVTQAKLQALQAQVEPHFLYNTLASVQALTEIDPAQASAMTGHLIQYLRNALPKMREGVSTVGQEVELVRAYLNILQMRMGKRLTFEIAIPEDLAGIAFPPLMLPSLVENCIKHGLEPQREGGQVHISANSADGKLRFIVADTGRGFGESIGAGVGLANIRERLAALYGSAGKLTLEANQPRGVVATIEVPLGVSAATSSAPEATIFAPGEPQPAVAAAPAAPRTTAQKTFAAMASAERVWRKALSFAFVGLVVLAAVGAGLAMVAMLTGAMPINVGEEVITGPGGALVGTAAIALAFLVVVLALAVVVAVVYGLGFLMVALAIFVPLAVIVSLVPVLAPVILVGLAVWWFARRKVDKPGAVPASVK